MHKRQQFAFTFAVGKHMAFASSVVEGGQSRNTALYQSNVTSSPSENISPSGDYQLIAVGSSSLEYFGSRCSTTFLEFSSKAKF